MIDQIKICVGGIKETYWMKRIIQSQKTCEKKTYQSQNDQDT